jgi:hypothetical protein
MCWVLRAWVEVQGLLTIVDVVNGMGISHANKKERQDASTHRHLPRKASDAGGGLKGRALLISDKPINQRASERAQVSRKETGEGHTEPWHVGCGWRQGSFKTTHARLSSDRHVCVTRPSQESGVCRGIHGGMSRARAGQRCCNSETRSCPRVTGVGARTGLLLVP